MADSKRDKKLGDAAGAGSRGPDRGDQPDHDDRTAGTNRDFDETGESQNQGHGHPREERGRPSDSN